MARGEASAMQEQVLQLQGVVGGEASFFVVEAAEDLPALAAPGGDGLGPGMMRKAGCASLSRPTALLISTVGKRAA